MLGGDGMNKMCLYLEIFKIQLRKDITLRHERLELCIMTSWLVHICHGFIGQMVKTLPSVKSNLALHVITVVLCARHYRNADADSTS